MPLARHTAPDEPEPEATLADLTAAEPDRRRHAAQALGRTPEGVAAVLTAVPDEHDPVVLETMLTVLSESEEPAVAERLAVHLRSDDPALRSAVITALATMDAALPAVMPGLLADPDPDVRIRAVSSLADSHQAAMTGWLADVVRHDPDPDVVSAAVAVLLPVAGPEHTPLIAALPGRFPDDPFIRFVVERLLAGTGR